MPFPFSYPNPEDRSGKFYSLLSPWHRNRYLACFVALVWSLMADNLLAFPFYPCILRGAWLFLDLCVSFSGSERESILVYILVYPIINFEVVSGCVRVPQERVPQDVACVWNKIDRLPTSGSVTAR